MNARHIFTRIPWIDFGLTFLLVFLMLLAACAQAVTPTTAPAAAQKTAPAMGPTMAPAPTEAPAPAAASTIQLTLAITYFYTNPTEVIQDEVNRFTEANSDIKVDLIVLPPGEMAQKIATMSANGLSPDITTLNYNEVATQQINGSILPLSYDEKLFIADAVKSNYFGERVYGMPWYRYGCAPNYYNFVLMKGSPPDNQPYAQKLMEFLTDDNQQLENLEKLKFYPTRQSLYDGQKVYCRDVSAVRVPAQDVQEVVKTTTETISVLSKAFNVPLNYLGVTAAYDDTSASIMSGRHQTTGFMPASGSPIQLQSYPVVLKNNPARASVARLVPAASNDDYYNELRVFGSLIIDDDKHVDLGDPHAPIGSYLVLCNPDEKACELIDAQSKEYKINVDDFDTTSAPVEIPVVAVEPISSYWGCWYIDGLRMCIKLF